MTSEGTLLVWRIVLWAAPIIGGIIGLVANYKINSIETKEKKEKEKIEAAKAVEREKKLDSIISDNVIKEKHHSGKPTEKPNPDRTENGKDEIKKKKNVIEETNELKKDTKESQTVNVTSINQQGGITANEVNIYNKEPESPIESEIIKILNTINPSILERYKNGESQICILISQSNLLQLSKIRSELIEKKILTYKSNGSVNYSRGGQIGNCINDLDEGYLHGYNVTFLDNFKFISK